MTTFQKVALVIVLAVSVVTRFTDISHIPANLSNDEISIAYDAYSVGLTGRDEHNHILPISFQSHGTYKAPVAIYMAIPTIALFGNHEFGARLPSMALGVFSVIFLGALTYKLTKKLNLALLVGFVLAINPWHIYASRIIYESNLALFFVISGIYLFFASMRSGSKFAAIGSAVVFAASIYSYHTQWGFTPLILLVLAAIYRSHVFRRPIYYTACLLFGLLVLPIFMDFVGNLGTTARANTEIFTKDINLEAALKSDQFTSLQKGQLMFDAFLGNYSSYVSPTFLFFDGHHLLPKGDPYQVGLFLAPLVLFFYVGLFKVQDYFKEDALFIYIWAAVAPIVPALTHGGPNIVRLLVAVPVFALIIALGVYGTWKTLQKHRLIYLVTVSVLFLSFMYFAIVYYYYYRQESGEGFQYAYKPAAYFIKDNYHQYDKVIVDPKFGSYGQFDGLPHLYFGYFTKLDPHQILNRKDGSQGLSFDKYEVREIRWGDEKITPRTLYVVPYHNPPLESLKLKLIKDIPYPNNSPALKLYTL